MTNDSKSFDLSSGQQEAADKVKGWYEEADELRDHAAEKPIFRLFGYAGTGKTTTIRAIISQLGLTLGADVLFGAYTGKAAMVMRRQGLPAATIHSLIYKVVDPDRKACSELYKKLNEESNEGERNRIRQELQIKSKPSFQLRLPEETPLEDASLLVLDECSMVNSDMLKDLLTFEVPLLVLGDPGQLPPIEGESPLTSVSPDVMLTEIHRQAEGNPIIAYATRARQNIPLPFGEMGTSRNIMKSMLSRDDILSFDQILCGKNNTRKAINTEVRQLKGFTSPYPLAGEKLICLRNSTENGLFNGMICYVDRVGDLLDSSLELFIRRETDDENATPIRVLALRAHFDSYHDKDALDRVKWWERTDADEFDFGYGITVHKSQGSQWDNVCLIDDKMFKGWGGPQDRKRWLYTGITRAVDRICVAS